MSKFLWLVVVSGAVTIVLVVLAVWIMMLTVSTLPWLKWVYLAGVLIVFIFLVLGFIKSFMSVSEGYGIIITLFGAYFKFKLVWGLHEFKNGRIVAQSPIEATKEGEEVIEPEPRSGLRWIGWPRWAFKLYRYHLQIMHLDSQGKPEMLDIPNHHLVRAKRDVYVFPFRLDDEDPLRDSQGIPFGILLTVPASIVAPFIAFFGAERWSVVLTNAIKAFARPFFAQFMLDDIVDLRIGKKSEEIQVEQGVTFEGEAMYKAGSYVIDALRENIGKEFVAKRIGKKLPNGTPDLMIQGALVETDQVGILGIVPSEKYLAKYKATQEKAALIVKTEGEAEALTMMAEAQAEAEKVRGGGIGDGLRGRTVLAAIQAIADKYGITKEEVQEGLKNEGGFQKDYDEFMEQAENREAIDADVFRKYAYPEVAAGSSILDRAVDGFRNPMGGVPKKGQREEEGSSSGGGSGSGGQEAKPEKSQKGAPLTEEELKHFFGR